MKKVFKGIRNFVFTIITIACLCFTAFFLLYRNQIQTISSITKIDDYPVYTMDYKGTYWFEDFLKNGGYSSRDDFNAFFNRKLTYGLTENIDFFSKDSVPMCTCFACENEKGEILFCRNMENTGYLPSVVVTTHDGTHSSVGTARLVNTDESAPEWYQKVSFLAEPYFMGDGMNDAGLAVSILSVPYSQIPDNREDMPTLSSEQICRLILNEAGTVDEAIALFDTFNTDYSPLSDNKSFCHYFIADKSGAKAVVELHDGIVYVVESPHENFMTVTNFYLNDALSSGSGQSRYKFIEEILTEEEGILSIDEALYLLSGINDPILHAQWSCVYNLTTGEMYIFPNGEIENIYRISYTFEESSSLLD